jgi:hypothetical protein
MLRVITTVVTLALLTAASLLHAQGLKIRPATQDEFVGFWKLLPYPASEQPRVLPANPFPGECQFFAHFSDGAWMHVVREMGRCEETASTLEKRIREPGFGRIASFEVGNGRLLINRHDQRFSEPWKIDLVLEIVDIPGLSLQPGDLLMQLVDIKGKEIIWRRLLRRLPP